MKKAICLVVLLINASVVLAKASPNVKVVGPLNTIRVNAKDASDNAGIYQWMRVNREVDRIVADARKVEKVLISDAASADALKALQKSVRELRSARLAHDVNRIQAAAHQVADACDSLLAK